MSIIDERFLTHRLRSSSTAGIVTGVISILLWYYRYAVDHQWSWDLFAIAVAFPTIKIALMIWYRFTD